MYFFSIACVYFIIQVVEQKPGHWKKDVDYIKPGSPFTIRWTNVFIGDSKVMEKFRVYLSTYPGGMCNVRSWIISNN